MLVANEIVACLSSFTLRAFPGGGGTHFPPGLRRGDLSEHAHAPAGAGGHRSAEAGRGTPDVLLTMAFRNVARTTISEQLTL